jgi:hypothetical protein
MRRKLATDHKDGSLKVLCELGGWKRPKTVLKCYQQAGVGQRQPSSCVRRRFAT